MGYEHAVVMVSHDRFFLDRTTQVVYELEDGRLTRYPGNYTAYKAEKEKRYQLQRKAYERQRQEEEERLSGWWSALSTSPERRPSPGPRESRWSGWDGWRSPGTTGPRWSPSPSSRWCGGGKWGVYGGPTALGLRQNPAGAVLSHPPGGPEDRTLRPQRGGKDHAFKDHRRPSETSGGRDGPGGPTSPSATLTRTAPACGRTRQCWSILPPCSHAALDCISSLSGGERARLVLAELLVSRPNFLVLDEPTNHMDIPAKEALEAAFRAYTGTILFVSHDRYLIRQVADSILIFEDGAAMYYPFSYEHYLERKRDLGQGGDPGGPGIRQGSGPHRRAEERPQGGEAPPAGDSGGGGIPGLAPLSGGEGSGAGEGEPGGSSHPPGGDGAGVDGVRGVLGRGAQAGGGGEGESAAGGGGPRAVGTSGRSAAWPGWTSTRGRLRVDRVRQVSL